LPQSDRAVGDLLLISLPSVMLWLIRHPRFAGVRRGLSTSLAYRRMRFEAGANGSAAPDHVGAARRSQRSRDSH